MFTNTIGVVNKIKNDVIKLCSVVNTASQVIFLLSYVYSIIANVDAPRWLAVYSTLLAVSAIYFAFYLVFLINKSDRFDKKLKKNARRGFKYAKLCVQAVVVGFSVFEIVTQDVPTLTVLKTVVLAISFAAQLLIEGGKVVVTRYCDLLTDAFKTDVAPYVEKLNTLTKIKDTVTNPKAVLAAALDKPVTFLADKLKKKKEADERVEVEFLEAMPTAPEKAAGKIHQAVLEIGEEQRLRNEEIKLARKQKKVADRKRLADEKKSELKEHLTFIGKELKQLSDKKKAEKAEKKQQRLLAKNVDSLPENDDEIKSIQVGSLELLPQGKVDVQDSPDDNSEE